MEELTNFIVSGREEAVDEDLITVRCAVGQSVLMKVLMSPHRRAVVRSD